ncbi:MAG: ABC transporter ATP-binding protein [Pseudomonadota bacterium]
MTGDVGVSLSKPGAAPRQAGHGALGAAPRQAGHGALGAAPRHTGHGALGEVSLDDGPLLRAERVTKTFADGTAALGDLTMGLDRREFVSLLGPSGCGKSTALRLIAGLAEPTGGRIDWPSGRPDIGVVFQEPTLAPWSTVFGNVWLPLRLRGRSRRAARARVEAAIAAVGLQGFEGAYPRALSGGMRMRVSLARALVTDPGLMMMDEPFAALDEITRHRLNADMLALRDQARCAVLFVTHSVFESVFLSDRILVMAARPGRIVETIDNRVVGPRDAAFRTSADYAARCRHVSDALARAMGEPA